ncbi:MAG: CBS domain-containing protein [Patescibacteria group bacterium]|nr:CBS domain-containing protein [Patescibacteria group bacterium]
MRVAAIMQKKVDYVTTKDSVGHVSRIIFGHGINGVPVCKDKKLVGFITERDILSKFFPSMQEYIEDPVHARDFESMEKKISEILSLSADDIMTKNPISITSDTPVLHAQSLMFVNKIGRLPIVDDSGTLVGIISKGDIFKAVVGKKLILGEEEGFYDWMSKYYDVLIDWEERLSQEIPDLVELFKAENTKRILDVASSTGEHSIGLVKKGFQICGLDRSSLINEVAEKKKNKLVEEQKERIKFFAGNYKEIISSLPHTFDAAIFMGNALPHVINTKKDIVKEVVKVLEPKNSLLFFQIINFDRIFELRGGVREFVVRKSSIGYGQEHAFLLFIKKGQIIL